MSLTWPLALLALLAFPILLAYRWWMRRRRRRDAVRLSSVTLVRAALAGRTGWRRRIPLALFGLGLVVLSIGAARPTTNAAVPSDSSAILLAIDVSASMCSTDVTPNRITAAENAAAKFIKAQKDGTKIGLVEFSGIPVLLVPPTSDRNTLLSALPTLKTARGTAIGLGILAAIDAIADINPDVAHTGVDLPAGSGNTTEYAPDTIVVLTDGANTQGVDPVTAAQQAAARHVRVYTIGFGTSEPAPLVCSSDQIGGNAFGPFGGGQGRGFGGGFGGGGFGRGRSPLQADPQALQQVAGATGGKYFQAQDADQLDSALSSLPSSIVLEHKHIEVTVWFAFIGALLVLAAVGLAQWWNRSIPPPAALVPAGR
jgi:Ca-activated chloride channel family protein